MSDRPTTRVLVTDDAATVRELLCLLFEMEDDFEVVAEARDGREAVHAAQSTSPDLVLMDLAMPVMDGLEAIRQLRRTVTAAKIVVFSGFDPATVADSAVRAGADRYIEKGTGVTELIARLREVCGMPAPE